MKALATILFCLALTFCHAQGAPMAEPQPSLLKVPGPEPTPGWYIQKAGKEYNNGMYFALLGAMLGGGLMASTDQGLRTTGIVIGSVCISVGIGFTISGNGRLERAGWLMQQ